MVSASIDKNTDPKSLQINSSFQTVSSLINQMVGGTMLVLPLLFSSTGIIGGSINLIITGIISTKSNLIYVDHLKEKEMDYQFSILRILGENYEFLYKLVKWIYLFFIIMIYFTLITLQLYSIILFILESAGVSDEYYVPLIENGKKSNQFQFGKLNVFYMTIVSFLINLLLVSIKNIGILVKIAGYGVITIISFVIFIIYIFFDSITHYDTTKFDSWGDAVKSIPLFSYDIGSLAGTLAMAFAVQINSCTAVKCNKNQKNNVRDIIYTYLSGGMIYLIIGVLGSMAVTSIGCEFKTVPTINGCFADTNIMNLIVIIIYISHLISAFPIYFNISRQGLIELFFKGKTPSNKVVKILDLCQLLFFCIIQNIPFIDPDSLMSLNGAVCCFFYVYQIPLMMDIQCYHGNNALMKKIKRSLSRIHLIRGDDYQERQRIKSEMTQKYNNEFEIEKENQVRSYGDNRIGTINIDEDKLSESLIENEHTPQKQDLIDIDKGDSIDFDAKRIQYQKENEENRSIQEGSQIIAERKESCNYHGSDPRYKTVRIVVYGVIFLIGLSVLFYEIYLVTANIVNSF